ncbi:hypothetical protein ACHAXT_003604 [Thalassiosira profunda]
MSAAPAPRCGSCGKCGFCSPRVVRLPSELAAGISNKDSRAARALEVKENVDLERCARDIVELKIRPEILREDVVPALAKWLREMLVGPALPLNKQKNFIPDVLESKDLMADAEIFVETLPGCHQSLVERNRKDETKRQIYPDIDSPLRVREDVLRGRCAAMVNHFSKKKNVTDEGLKDQAAGSFYDFYLETITEKRPKSYNSYTGVMACMGDVKFLKQSEDIVLFGLGLTEALPEGLAVLKRAPPPLHTVLVFVVAMALCVWALPSLQSIDELATFETFTTPVFQDGAFNLSPIALGIIRLSFAGFCLVTTLAKMRQGCFLQLVLLPGSKLKGGSLQIYGMRTQWFYTSWAWNILGFSFFLGGIIPLLVAYGREDILQSHPWVLRAALVSFEIAAPSAFLTSFIVTYALWPQAYKDHGPKGTMGFKRWVNISQHCGNSAMVLMEVCLMGGLPVLLSHAAFAPLFAGVYQLFVWAAANRWTPNCKQGPVMPYFFMDTTLGVRTSVFMLVLLAVIGLFFVLFALLNRGLISIEDSGHGALPNVCCAIAMAYLLTRYKD